MDKDKDKKSENESTTSVGFHNKNEEIISFFDDNNDFVFVFKKTEKLATALYLVTNLFEDSEPLKWTLRKKTGELLSLILGYKDIISSKRPEFTDDINSKVLELVSMLEIASRSGLVSVMNFSIINQEFSNLLKTIQSQNKHDKESKNNVISESFFDVPKKADEPENVISEKINNFELGVSQTPKIVENPVKDINSVSDKSAFKRSNRQNIILALLKKKSDLSIKDIALVIQGCSEKTVQRELISLIDSGLVKKTGERRWSKYSLNKQERL